MNERVRLEGDGGGKESRKEGPPAAVEGMTKEKGNVCLSRTLPNLFS